MVFLFKYFPPGKCMIKGRNKIRYFNVLNVSLNPFRDNKKDTTSWVS